MILFETGSPTTSLSREQLCEGLHMALDRLGERRRVLVLPPDITRVHSRAGCLTCAAHQYYGDRIADIMPATGTHEPMTDAELARMFPGVPRSLFRNHDWRHDIQSIGVVPSSEVSRVTAGRLAFDWDAQVNRLVVNGGHDLVLSIGQVVPHEVVGMANHNKNILVGTGGHDNIHKTHYVGAVCGMEDIMGRIDTPVRRLLNKAMDDFLSHVPVVYVQTVIARDEAGALCVRGLFVSDGDEAFQKAAELAQRVNIHLLDAPIRKAVVYLEPGEFRSTWLGNKSIYRTRMAIADGGELLVLAPGLRTFGEDQQIDALIRKYGYRTTPETLQAVEANADLAGNLAAAAHLIHGSSENRFRITYCPGQLTRQEIESVNYTYGDLEPAMARYPVTQLADGFNTLPDGEEIFFVSNPALGLWAQRSRFT